MFVLEMEIKQISDCHRSPMEGNQKGRILLGNKATWEIGEGMGTEDRIRGEEEVENQKI